MAYDEARQLTVRFTWVYNSTVKTFFPQTWTWDGTSWTVPSPLYDNPDPGLFQYMPWVQVSRDHVVHASFGATVTSLEEPVKDGWRRVAEQRREPGALG